ncbi:hypothetical protein RQP46_002102 [Phenoliferia psychrophenolica]
MEKEPLLPLKELPQAQPRSAKTPLRRKAVVCLAAAALAGLGAASLRHNPTTASGLTWTDCGSRIECSTLEVPMDWSAAAVGGPTVQLALARLPARSKEGRLGSIIVNPGGPGGSGTGFVFSRGAMISTVVEGRYDIVGFDPRGINLSTPHISCFPDKLSEHIFNSRAPALNIPVNFTSISSATGVPSNPAIVISDLEAQVRAAEATFAALYVNCGERSGEAAAFVGTQSVVKDIDFLSRTLDGPDSRINFWGFSYGTIIGQYLTAIIPPERLGRVIIDGVVDAVAWNGDARGQLIFGGLDDVEDVYTNFAKSCANAKENCALASLGSADAILAAVDGVVDALYHSPVALATLPEADFVGRAHHARSLLFTSAYSIRTWPALAEHFAAAHFHNFTGLVNATLSYLPEGVAKAAKEPDSSARATMAITCADSRPYNSSSSFPTSSEVTTLILDALRRYSPRVGESFFSWTLCHLWPVASKSYYGGGFTMPPDTLDTPILILSQRYDPVTPLSSAKKALKNLGVSNARLVEQDGNGHCSISQASLCTAKIVRIAHSLHFYTECVLNLRL